MKGDSSLCATNDCRQAYVCLPDCTALFGALPRGRGPMPRSLRRWAAAPAKAPRLPRRNRRLGLVLDCTNTYKEGCSASAARQAVGGSRGAVVKPRTPQGHPQARTVGGWFVHGGRDGQAEMNSAKSHGIKMRVRGGGPPQQAMENCE